MNCWNYIENALKRPKAIPLYINSRLLRNVWKRRQKNNDTVIPKFLQGGNISVWRKSYCINASWKIL